MTDRVMSPRAEAIARLTEEERRRWDELRRLGDDLNYAHTALLDAWIAGFEAPVPERRDEILETLEAQRNRAWREARDYLRELGVPES